MAEPRDLQSDAAPGASPTGADPVPALIAAGDHLAAARLCVERGELARAISLYDRLWRFADALPLAERLGDHPLAIRLALDAGEPARAIAIAERIPRDAETELGAAARAFAARGRHWDAARMAERARDVDAAAAFYRRAGALLDAGRMDEAAGRARDAGLAYEQALAAAASAADAAAAGLALGRLLERLGRHHDAARTLQQAMRAAAGAAGSAPASRIPAGRALIGALLALGLPVAAAEIARRLRREAPDLPEAPEEIAALDAADAAAGASTVGQRAGEPGLLRRRFKVLRSLGAGATSQVYLAEDTLLGQPVALKLLSVGAGGRGTEREAYVRFAREAEAAGRLRHPNIIALHDADPTMGLFVLELASGGTLADQLATSGPLGPGAGRRLALDLLSALGAAHEHGIIHRDVKPANVFFDAGGNAKLGDFGGAHLVDFGQTQTGGLLGTLAYMSPEQISGAAIGPATDLYALGVTLFQVLTGHLPFPGPDIVAQHLGSEPPVPSAVRPRLSPAHDQVLLRALRKAPADRWASAAEMAEAVRAWPIGAHGVERAGDAQASDAAADARAADAAETTVSAAGLAAAGADPAAPDVALGRSSAGTLWRHDDANLGRPVLIEALDAPIDGAALEALRARAAVGGPYVQRVLALSDDHRTVTYELCDGPPVSLGSLPQATAAALVEARAAADRALRAAGLPPLPAPPDAVATAGGPVIPIVIPLRDAADDRGSDALAPAPSAAR